MNNKLALKDEILLTIDKPARYIGNEVNMVRKNPEAVKIRVAFAFPDVYEIGMSHLGIQILYHQFNLRNDVYCERVYSPWPDLHKIMKEQQIPLFALETQDPIKDFDFLCMTLQYELCYPNILQILDLGGIPLKSADRTDHMPIVIGGGPCAYNPEPIADFFDIFYIGEGETVYDDLFDLYEQMKEDGSYSRQNFLHEAAKIPGLYVPSLYEVSYKEDGTIAGFQPVYEDIPTVIHRQVVENMSESVYPDKPLVPFIKVTQDRVVLEIQRGCIRGCRFCQAGMVYRPLRERSLEMLKEKAYQMLTSTGHEEISLSSLSSSDYTYLEELLTFLIDEFKDKGVNISLPSLRIDAFSLDVMSKVQDIRKSSLTFAPEAGSQRLRDVINKGLTKENILHGAGLAFEGGWNKVKLYFMLGQPTETIEDMKAIGELAEEIAERYYEIPKDQRNGKCQITVSTSFFVPKPFTPFQWSPMCTKDEFLGRAKIVNETIKSQLNKKSIRYNWHEADVTMIEGILARGDRRLCNALIRVYEKGGIFAAWSEFFDDQIWQDAFAEEQIDTDFYTTRARQEDEIFPWDFIDAGVTKQFLLREWHAANEETVTPNCRQKCAGCGAMKYKGEAYAMRIRIKFRKYGVMRFIGHLDIMRYFQKAMRRANIDIAYSEGFSPHQIMSFAAPLGVGITSDGEYLDIEAKSTKSTQESIAALNAVMVDGIEITQYVALRQDEKKAMTAVGAADYIVYFKNEIDFTQEELEEKIRIYYEERSNIEVTKQTKKSERVIDLKPLIYLFRPYVEKELGWQGFFLQLSAGSTDNIKPELVLQDFYQYFGEKYHPFNMQIHRVETYEHTEDGLRPLYQAGDVIEA